jgi:TetR/AcrR family transcriptional repressor of nem operon
VGRKKGYDRDILVAKALGVFHRLGYNCASTEVIVNELGVNRNSVYSEFGSKAELFSAALELYERKVVSFLFGPLEAVGANLDEIEALYREFLTSVGEANGLGCLMCNTAAEFAGADVTLQPRIQSYFDRLYKAFLNALLGAVRMGQIRIETVIELEARLLTSNCLGIFLMARAGLETSASVETIQATLTNLRLMRAPRPACASSAISI